MNKIITTYTLILLLSTKLIAINLTSEPKKIPAYYIAPTQTLNALIMKLENHGFNILATTKVLEHYNIITITNEELQNTNSYMATLQLNVNLKEIRVQNPSYLAKAYLDENYHYGEFENTINALKDALGTLSESPQKADFSALPEYSFMYGLPKREDVLTIRKGSDIIKKILRPETKKYLAYTLTLPNGNILVGHKLSTKTNDFLHILHQEKNAQILPYEAMINGQEVSIMNPKYYLALSLPMLSLHEFMQIASVPDRIYRNIKKAYQ
ncbi:MAG: Unknown protein [uncultured Sulfurovum sp.]|uniref:Uncharacterized protein n=1 Tax=uncultured Sulfurovum sp. TaxID=269237 RepID=A0A6S6TPQ9_9BACT|nr:MAG: Unknown protein [uncultured Sulfurovum sp.]